MHSPRTTAPRAPGPMALPPAGAVFRGLLVALLLLPSLPPNLRAAPPPPRYAPGVGQRLSGDRARGLDDIRQALAELPRRDEALRLAGRPDPDRERIISRLLSLRGASLGDEPESLAIACGLLDLLLADPALRETPDYARLVTASEAAARALIANRPRLRARMGTWLEEQRSLPGREPGRPAAIPDSPLRPGVMPLPRATPGAAGSMLLETGETRSWEVPSDARALWIPGREEILIVGHDALRRVDTTVDGAPRAVGPIRPGAPVALSPAGDYVATVTTETGGARDRLVLYRLLENGDGVVIETGQRILALAWAPDGGRLAVAGERGLVLRDVDRATVLRTTHPAADLAEGRTSLHWSPDGERLLVVRRDPRIVHATTREAFHLALIDTRRGARLDTLSIDDAVALSWAPDSRTLWVVMENSAVAGVDARDDRLPPPRPITLAFDPAGEATGRGVIGLAFSPDGRHLAIDAVPGAESLPGGAATRENGLFPPSLVHQSGSRAALLSRADSLATRPRPCRPGSFAPEGPAACRISWHPGSRWLLLSHRGNLGSETAEIVDRITGDARPLGWNAVTGASFSADGRGVAWLESEPPRRTRLHAQRLTAQPMSTDAGRRGAFSAIDDLNLERSDEAVIGFRNAVRLAPDVAAHRHGLARAYRAVAGNYPEPALQAFYLEGAARAATSAWLLDGRSRDVWLDFLELTTARALVAGRFHSRELRAAVEHDLREIPGPAIYAAAGNRAARLLDRLAAALLWDPDDELLRILYEGLAARWAEAGEDADAH